ncbi:MAG TPA: N-acetylmuramoyl-L-alanine amidase [Longimicrobiales bacterium]|nr:N-acetylmuramoyl-L-alanine amidase [Longimicrobiales bacterium]
MRRASSVGRRALGFSLVLAACSSNPAPRTPVLERSVPGVASAIPAIPLVDAPLRLDVAYPPEGSSVAVRDSNFIFGSTGSGNSTLSINGANVEVKPNGAWLAYLPVPSDGVYRLQATKGTETASFERHIKVTPVSGTRATNTRITTVTPGGALATRLGENVEVSLTGTSGGQAWLVLPSKQRIPLVESRAITRAINNAADFQTQPTASQSQSSSLSRYSGILSATALNARDTAIAKPGIGDLATQTGKDSVAYFELVVGIDTVRAPIGANITTLSQPRVGVAVDRTQGGPHREWRTRGRNDPSGPFHFFWPHGTQLTITGQRGNFYRVQLAGDMTAWVPVADVQLLPTGTPPPGGPIGSARFIPNPGYIDLRLSLPDRLPYFVEETERGLQLDVYGGVSQVNFFQYGAYDPLIERAQWSQPRDSIFRVNVTLTKPVWGYDVFHDANGGLVLRIRRPPVIDPQHPLRGIRVMLDPGHGGKDTATIGPTRFAEAHANLAEGLALKPLLEAAGAKVIMSRSTNIFLELGERTQMAVDSSADILVSLHNNAFPDGVNPFVNNGTSTYYYHPQSVDLAQSLLREITAELGLRDIGYGRADLALVRPTWLPASLTETSFMMVPEQEAGFRNPEWVNRIARAHLRGIENFLRKRAAAQ